MDKLFERFHRKQIYARAAIVRSVLVGCAAGIVLIFLALTPAFATFYEVNGKIIFDKKPLRDVDVYLLKEAHDVIKRKSIDGKQTEEITHQEFKEVNERLAKRQKEIALTSNKGEGIKTRKAVIRDFKKLIKQHLLRKIRVDKEGSIYLNIGSAVTYHIVILKREKLFKKNKPFIFWVEEVYFEPADIEDPKEMLFDESNVINW